MSTSRAARPRQRTKAGCLPCRRRRKKCNEERPICDRCRHLGCECEWPSSADLVDRRFASHAEFRHHRQQTRNESPSASSSNDDQGPPATRASPQSDGTSDDSDATQKWAMSMARPVKQDFKVEAGAAHKLIARDMDNALATHFGQTYYGLLLPTGCHLNLFESWRVEVDQVLMRSKSLYYAGLAHAASHYHLQDGSPQMQQLALKYYSASLRETRKTLAATDAPESNDDLLMSILLLSLHGVCSQSDRCMGKGTIADNPRHVDAATRILSLRLQNDGPTLITQPFNRLSADVMIHQAFLAEVGLWSEVDDRTFGLDLAFWLRAESLLEGPADVISINCPVGADLKDTPGASLSIMRVIMVLSRQYRAPDRVDTSLLDAVRPEVKRWEKMLLSNPDLCEENGSAHDHTAADNTQHPDAGAIYALIASLLLFQLTEKQVVTAGPPLAVPSESWQIKKALLILQRHKYDDAWSGCFVGNWAVYTLGFFFFEAKHIDMIRWEVQRRWKTTNFGQILRFSKDLETTWALRGLPAVGTPEVLPLR